MMICPVCGHAPHTRSSQQISSDTKERYNQCQNINCGATFVSHETVTRFISKPLLIERVEPHLDKYCQQALAIWSKINLILLKLIKIYKLSKISLQLEGCFTR